MKPFVINSVLAPTDLTDSSIPALRYALLFTDRFLASLTVMYAEPVIYPDNLMGLTGGIGNFDTTPEHEASLRRAVEEHSAPVLQGHRHEIDVAVGQPIPAILNSAKERNADLIVTGTHLRHGWRRALLGSVSEGVLHGSKCPVLTVATRDGYVGAAPYAITSILCPVNFTDVARESLRVATGLAEAFGAHLTIVHVLERDGVMDAKAVEEKIRQWVAPELQNICSFRELVVRGGAAERVLDCADDLGSDFLVIGAQHRLFRDATVIGTTAERLIRFASCPVLVVPRQAVPLESSGEIREEPAATAER